ncbi:MAG TPA: redoxin family protein [Pyrinomonadaceae bacterium]|jgi:thiol-disulfide isomerase/thioredoxin|nr:redoxin family protein [Pyrinomonadaceae bacterium]
MEDKKSKLARTIEIATNLSIITVALIGATVLVKNYLLRPATPVATIVRPTDGTQAGPRDSGRNAPTGPAAGTQIAIPGVNWTDSDQTVVLALSDKCHFCTESAPFYQKLTQELAGRKNVRVVAVFPQDTNAAKQYLAGLNVPITAVAQATLDSLGVRGTPTLVIVDKSGTVQQSWVGRLTAERETEVFSRIKS